MFSTAMATRLDRPVISVGNLSMGGRGKTPVTALVARLLIEAGERPAILSRGYGRRSVDDGVVVVSDGRHLLADVDRSGDEPLMLARAVPGAAVLVCEQRAIAGKLAEQHLGATVHVLDDGFQHRSLARDIDIVIVTARDFADRRVPFGRLRAPVDSLHAADALVIDGSDREVAVDGYRAERFVLRRTLGEPIAFGATKVAPYVRSSRSAELQFRVSDPIVTLAGIANPARFVKSLQDAGWQIARSLEFRDHHRYDRRDLETIARAVRETGAAGVLTTEKDAVRLMPLRPLPFAAAAVPLHVSVEPVERFRAWIFERLREAAP